MYPEIHLIAYGRLVSFLGFFNSFLKAYIRTGLLISFISSDLSHKFHTLLHTPKSIYTFALLQLRSINATENNEMCQISCLQLLVILCILTGRPIIFGICEIPALFPRSFHAIRMSDHFKTNTLLR